MGGYGVPRYLCDNCAEQIEVATTSQNIDEISAAIKALGSKLSLSDHDSATMDTMNEILNKAMERGRAIKAGSYDFSLDDEIAEEDTFELNDELLESEEDKKLDEEEEAKNKKMNAVLNWISIILFSALGVFAVYRILDMFLF